MELIKLKKLLQDGLSYRDISKIENCSPKKVEYWVKKHNLMLYNKYNREYQKNVDHNFFKKIDTPEKAYILGFILGDGYIRENNDVEISVQLNDKQIIDDISNVFPWELNIGVSEKLNKKSRTFPKVRTILRSRKIGIDLIKHFGNRLASKRRTPIIKKNLEKYLVSGFFDADGCITWGYRKDRNRLWHKVNFTASDTILIGIQKILYKNGICSQLRPKKNENVHLIEFSGKNDIIKFYGYLPQDNIRLKRKVIKFNQLIEKIKKAPLRPESDEFGENSNYKNNTEPSTISV